MILYAYFCLKAQVDPPATAKNEIAIRSELLDLKFDLGFDFLSPENIYILLFNMSPYNSYFHEA